MPIAAAHAIARSGRLVRRSAPAAGPISSAVLRIVPIVIAASAAASASASRYSAPIILTRMPRAAAISAFSELSSSGR